MKDKIKDTEKYRDHISTVDKDGKRKWIYPKQPKGKFYTWRSIVSIILLVALFGMPFIKVNGEPLMLFNVIERKFIILGVIFTPQDLYLFALAMITIMLFIVLFTVVFGRLFCGWVCPQTIFMEMVYRKIEYWIEGSDSKQKRLNKAPWTREKIWKKGLKHTIFFAIAVLMANTFLAYIIGVEQVFEIMSEPISENFGGFISMLIFSGMFYFVFASFREQVCVAVCPYGRLQSVLLMPSSIVVIYDFIRGEPRGKIRKKKKKAHADSDTAIPLTVVQEEPQGDCVSCNLCVRVCPTGIDIRNGTQLECVNCTACMDACDEVMEKVGREKGLIRYDSLEGIEENRTRIMTPRAWAYSGLLLVLIAVQAFLFSNRAGVETVILRTPGKLYQKIDENNYTNLYNYQVINKTTKNIEDISFKLKGVEGKINVIGKVKDAPIQDMATGSFFIQLDKSKLTGTKTEISIEIYSKGELVDETSTNFHGPAK